MGFTTKEQVVYTLLLLYFAAQQPFKVHAAKFFYFLKFIEKHNHPFVFTSHFLRNVKELGDNNLVNFVSGKING